MDRVNGANTIDIGGGKRGFTDENPLTGIAGTDVPAAWLNSIQENLLTVIESAGLEANSDDWALLYKALIALRGVDNDTVTFLNIYPTILRAGNVADVTDAGDGHVALGSFKWLWRQFKTLDVAAQNFATEANKIYHLRVDYDPATAVQTVALIDRTAVNEEDPIYDADYESLLLARVTTDGTNTPSILIIKNRAQLFVSGRIYRGSVDEALDWQELPNSAIAFAWPRQPKNILARQNLIACFNNRPNGAELDDSGGEFRMFGVREGTPTRYSTGNITYVYQDNQRNRGATEIEWRVSA